MPRSNDEKTREFQQKMRTEGAAGFGSGPWSEIEESLGMDQSVVVDQDGNPVWSVKHTRKPRHTGARSAFDRLLGGVAVLATATLVTSVLAIYSEQTREPGSSPLASFDVVTGSMSHTCTRCRLARTRASGRPSQSPPAQPQTAKSVSRT